MHLAAPETLVPPALKTRTYNYLSESLQVRFACFGWNSAMV